MGRNPYANHQHYADTPWAKPVAEGETQEELFAALLDQLRGQLNLSAQELDDPTQEVQDKVQRQCLALIEQHNRTAPGQGIPLLEGDPEGLAKQAVDEVLGWGPLSRYMRDGQVEEIILNNYDRGFVIYAGGRKEALRGFRSPSFARQFFNRKIEAGHGYPVNNKNPYQDAQLPDGSRLHVEVPPLTGGELAVVIRRFRPVAADLDALVKLDTITPAQRAFLDAACQAHLTLVVAGGTGTGKTTFLQALSRSFPESDRVLTIEDTPELQLDFLPDWVSLRVRHAAEGVTEIGMGQLVRNALRMRPTRIILGEARGAEMVDIMVACNTGHDGTLFTVHANSVRETTERMTTMYRMGRDLAPEEVRKEIVTALDLIIHLKRTPEGKRFVSGIGEVRRVEGQHISVEMLFEAQGDAEAATFTGSYPACREKLERAVPGFDFARDVVQRETGYAKLETGSRNQEPRIKNQELATRHSPLATHTPTGGPR